MTTIPRAVSGAARTRNQVRTITLTVDSLPDGSLRVTTPTARGWAAVARSQADLARAVQGAFTEAQVAAYAAWRGTTYDLSEITDHVPGDPLAPPRPKRRARRTRGGDGWGYGQQRPDVHLPTEWTELPDGRWRSPGGRAYRADAAVVQRVRARLAMTTIPTTLTA
jgi:hypothetical protein